MLTVVWAYRRTGKFAFHVLSGALAADPRTAAIPQVFAGGATPLREAVLAGLARSGDASPTAGTSQVLVAWSFYTPDFAAACDELRTLRAACDDPRVVHVAGGVHATAEPEATLRAGWDLVAIGEGERTIVDLALAAVARADLTKVAGTAALHGNRLHRTPRRERLLLDEQPPFSLAHGRFGPIEITRGCIYACRFCQTPYFAGAAFRHRSVANVRYWVRELVARGFRDFRFLTPTSLSYGAHGPEPDLAAVEALLAGVREDIGSDRRLWFGTFPSEVRPEHVTPQSLMLLRRHVTNRALILGGQSGSDRVLAASERGHDVATVERATALAIEHGFVPHVDFLFGLPGETPQDVAATLQCMDRLVALGAKVHGHTFLPLPGTPFRRAAPGRLDREVRQRLLALASRGSLYGQWQQQEVLAARLATPRELDSDQPPTRIQG